MKAQSLPHVLVQDGRVRVRRSRLGLRQHLRPQHQLLERGGTALRRVLLVADQESHQVDVDALVVVARFGRGGPQHPAEHVVVGVVRATGRDSAPFDHPRHQVTKLPARRDTLRVHPRVLERVDEGGPLRPQ